MTQLPDLETFLKTNPLTADAVAACDAETRALIERAARLVANGNKCAERCTARACRRAGACAGRDPFGQGFACGVGKAHDFSAVMRLVVFALMERLREITRDPFEAF